MKRLILILLASCGAVYAQQNAMLLPWVPQQFTNTNGTVLANGKVCTYQAGTSTGLASYTDATAATPNNVPPNAILLDSTGRANIWLKVGLAYKIVFLTAGSDNTCNTGVTIKTQDNVVVSANTFTSINGCQYVNSSQTFAAALAAASNPGCIEVSPGTYPVSVNSTIPSGVILRSNSGGLLAIGNAATLTINGPISAPPQQLFTYTGSGTAVFGTNSGPLYSAWFPGADIGAQLNNAYTALPSVGGKILVIPASSGCYSEATTVNFTTSGKSVILEGIGPTSTTGDGSFTRAGVCINFTPTNANMFNLDYVQTGGASYISGHGFKNILLQNNGCVTNFGCGGTAIALAIGTTNAGIQKAVFDNIQIEGFNTALSVANNNSWGFAFNNSTFTHNNLAVVLSNSLEAVNFINDLMIYNGTAFTVSGNSTELVMTGGSCDANSGGSAGVGCLSSTGNNVAVFTGVHFENGGACITQNCMHYINMASGQLTLNGGLFLDDTAGAANRDYMITAGNVQINGSIISSASETFTNLVVNNGSGIEFWQNAAPGVITNACPTFTSVAVLCYVQTNGGAFGTIPRPLGQIQRLAQVANIAATTIYTTNASGNLMQGGYGAYRICIVGWASVTGNSTVTFNALYSTGSGSVTAPFPQTLNTAALTNPGGGCLAVTSPASTAIQISVTGYNTTGTYNLQADIEQIF